LLTDKAHHFFFLSNGIEEENKKKRNYLVHGRLFFVATVKTNFEITFTYRNFVEEQEE
jgi:hypothetical protein